eukprot:2623304-Rhodomonas_salina.1
MLPPIHLRASCFRVQSRESGGGRGGGRVPGLGELVDGGEVGLLVGVGHAVDLEGHVGQQALHRRRLPRHDARLRPVLRVRRRRVLAPARTNPPLSLLRSHRAQPGAAAAEQGEEGEEGEEGQTGAT